MKEHIIKRLNEIASNSVVTDVWIIEYEGKRLSFTSGKGSWLKIGSAKNALRGHISMGNFRERLKAIKELEEQGVIKYIKL